MATAFQQPVTERKLWRDVSATLSVAASDNYSATAATLAACLSGYQIYLQKVTFSVTVEANTESNVLASGGLKYAEINNPSTEGPFTFDFGEDGAALPAGEDLQFKNSAAGTALIVYVQAYMRPAGSLVAKTAGATSGYNTL